MIASVAGCMPRPTFDSPAPPSALEAPSCAPEEAAFVYRRRIAPLLDDDRPASCNQCHLQGIDLRGFVRETACQSMACLVEKDLVDLQTPTQSGILALIDRARGGPTPQIAEAEYQGFLAWIEYSARCHDQACPPMANACASPEPMPDRGVTDAAVTADAGVDLGPTDAALTDAALTDAFVDMAALDATLVDAGPDHVRHVPGLRDDLRPCSAYSLTLHFQARVMRWRRRCHHCHADDGITAGTRGAPLWMVDGSDFESARQTAARVLAAGYVDLVAPDQSLLLLKPLTQRAGGVEHGGGNKFTRATDPAYLDFRSWIEGIARCGIPDLESIAPPDAALPDMGLVDAGAPPMEDAGRLRPLSTYCTCMLDRCHDTFHGLWGEDDDTARIVCLQQAARLSPDALSCRQAVCSSAPLLPDDAEDAVLCAGAVGSGLCELP